MVRRRRSKKWISWLLILILAIAAAVMIYLVWDNYFRDKKDEENTVEQQSLVEDKPTFCTTNVIVPFSVSAPAMVNGIRSPFSPTRTITKCPALRAFAMSGASISNL